MSREKYRKFLIIVFAVYLCAFIYYLSYTIYTFAEGESLTAMHMEGESKEKKLMPLGIPVGIYIRSKGIMVLDTNEVTGMDGNQEYPAKKLLKSGDYIICFNGTMINSIRDFTDMIQENGSSTCVLTVLREGKEKTMEITPIQTDETSYKLGVWVRQDAQGIGTLTFVDEDGNFAALGHGITDVDTGEIIEIQNGRLYESNILSIVKGKDGEPGEIIGHIDYDKGRIIGSICDNNEKGIYGTLGNYMNMYDENQALPIGSKDDIREGKALIRCNLDGESKDYNIIIEKVERQGLNNNRNLIIKITDEELIQQTNGIVQGMSGSPIIQNGKLIGAVTHVLVNDPTRGYGIFIENMLDAAG